MTHDALQMAFPGHITQAMTASDVLNTPHASYDGSLIAFEKQTRRALSSLQKHFQTHYHEPDRRKTVRPGLSVQPKI
jgi:hypothetical protein